MKKKKIKKQVKIREHYPLEPFIRANYVSGGCSCSGCLTGAGHIIGYFKY